MRGRLSLAVIVVIAGLVVVAGQGACRFSAPEGTPSQPSDGAAADSPGTDSKPPADAKPDPDAPPAAVCNTTVCSVAGGTCNPTTGHCVINQNMNLGVTCPPQHFCDITCSGNANSCETNGVDCSAAAGCTVTCGAGGIGDRSCGDGGVKCPLIGPCKVTCTGENTCRKAPVTCGNGPCDVSCLGDNACGDRGVNCRASLQCTASCKGVNACRNAAVACGLGTCNVTCDGTNACQNPPPTGVCAVPPPAMCKFHCCGTAATCQNLNLCTGCSKDAVCPQTGLSSSLGVEPGDDLSP